MQLKMATILLVDDEPILLEIMATWLSRHAGKVLIAEDGNDALRTMAAHEIDLVLSDIRMPVMSGIALLKKINELGPRRPRVIFITGFSDISSRQAHDLGAEAILEKPVKREELLEEAQRSLTRLEELWRRPFSGPAPEVKFHADFESLRSALQEKRIAFGRRGFCLVDDDIPYPGPVEFTLHFKADRRVVSGRGIVRWMAPQEHLAGIEITYVEDAARTWMIGLMQPESIAFIPASTNVMAPILGTV